MKLLALLCLAAIVPHISAWTVALPSLQEAAYHDGNPQCGCSLLGEITVLLDTLLKGILDNLLKGDVQGVFNTVHTVLGEGLGHLGLNVQDVLDDVLGDYGVLGQLLGEGGPLFGLVGENGLLSVLRDGLLGEGGLLCGILGEHGLLRSITTVLNGLLNKLLGPLGLSGGSEGHCGLLGELADMLDDEALLGNLLLEVTSLLRVQELLNIDITLAGLPIVAELLQGKGLDGLVVAIHNLVDDLIKLLDKLLVAVQTLLGDLINEDALIGGVLNVNVLLSGLLDVDCVLCGLLDVHGLLGDELNVEDLLRVDGLLDTNGLLGKLGALLQQFLATVREFCVGLIIAVQVGLLQSLSFVSSVIGVLIHGSAETQLLVSLVNLNTLCLDIERCKEYDLTPVRDCNGVVYGCKFLDEIIAVDYSGPFHTTCFNCVGCTCLGFGSPGIGGRCPE